MKRVERKSLHDQYYKKGGDYYKKEQFQTAISEFEKALDHHPNDTDTFHTKYGQPDIAEQYFRKALETCDPEQQEALIYNLDNALFDQFKFKESIVQYESISRKQILFKKAKANINTAKRKIIRY